MAQHILVFGVRLYRWVVSPAKNFVFGPLSQCRFTPSCSAYALEAITGHGALRGIFLALKRICRCHPWGGCGDDPVPPIQRPFALHSLDRKAFSQPQPSPGPTQSAFAPTGHACRSGH